jgi:hypothetical protein
LPWLAKRKPPSGGEPDGLASLRQFLSPERYHPGACFMGLVEGFPGPHRLRSPSLLIGQVGIAAANPGVVQFVQSLRQPLGLANMRFNIEVSAHDCTVDAAASSQIIKPGLPSMIQSSGTEPSGSGQGPDFVDPRLAAHKAGPHGRRVCCAGACRRRDILSNFLMAVRIFVIRCDGRSA